LALSNTFFFAIFALLKFENISKILYAGTYLENIILNGIIVDRRNYLGKDQKYTDVPILSVSTNPSSTKF